MAKKQEKQPEVATVVSVKFTFSPIGAYGLSYFIGEVAEIDALLASEIVANGHAEYVTEQPEVTEEQTSTEEQPEVTEEQTSTEEQPEVTE
jgi:hypothetical protein